MTVILASSTLLPFFHHLVPSRITLSIRRRRADSRSSSAIIARWLPIGDLGAETPRRGIRGLVFFFLRTRHSTRLRSRARGKVRGRIWHVWFSPWENVRRGDVGHDGIPADSTMGTTTALSRQAVINGAVIKPGKHRPDGLHEGGWGGGAWMWGKSGSLRDGPVVVSTEPPTGCIFPVYQARSWSALSEYARAYS